MKTYEDPIHITVSLATVDHCDTIMDYVIERDGGMFGMAEEAMQEAKASFNPYPGVTMIVKATDGIGSVTLRSESKVSWT